jgi:hypothetical protein
MPTFNTSYREEAPKITPSTAPTATGSTVSSRIVGASDVRLESWLEVIVGNRWAGHRDVERNDIHDCRVSKTFCRMRRIPTERSFAKVRFFIPNVGGHNLLTKPSAELKR